MKSTQKFVAAAFVSSLLSAAIQTQGAVVYNDVDLNYDPTQFGNQGGYATGNTALPGGTFIGATPVEIDLNLASAITLTSLGAGYNYGFGMDGFSPLIPNNSEAFTFSIELLDNGTLITPSFADDIANPFTFGFTELNPFTPSVDNLSVTTSTTALDPTLTFNEIAILVSNNTTNEAVADFSTELGVVAPPAAVPEPNTMVAGALMLLPFGMGVFRKLRK